MKNQKISVVALLLGASLAEVAELQQKQDDGLLDEEQILLELEHIAGQKELAELEEDIDIMDKQNFDFREYPTTEEYLMQDLSEKFGSDDEEMDNELLINLEQMNDISDSYESDSESNSDDEDLELEHIAGQKELAELEEDIDIMDKQNFDFREYPTTEEYLMQDLSEKFGSDDEEMDNELLINLEQMNDISDSYESDSESNSDDEDLELDDEELL
jgi:ribosomal protein L11